MKVAIAYASIEGQTQKIAQRIADTLRGADIDSLMINTREQPDTPWPAGCDGLIAGGPLHREHHPQELEQWLSAHREQWSHLPCAFFSVSLSASSDREQDRDDAWRVMHAFLDKLRMHPVESTILAGALKYSRYGFFMKRIMRNIVKRSGGKDLDMSHDYEYTDWHRVEQFARTFAERIGQGV
jgi:menaquinone-dependent protoporphyrinogen oxidase